MRFIRLSEYQKMSWKNGQGETLQIAIEPPGASLSNFTWRLSSAKVSASHEFSVYQDYERILTPIRGGALDLQIENQPSITLESFQILKFSGSEKIKCSSRSPEVIDLGLIYDPKQIWASLSFESPGDFHSNHTKSFVICLQEEFVSHGLHLRFLECLSLEKSENIKLTNQGQSVFAVVRIEQI